MVKNAAKLWFFVVALSCFSAFNAISAELSQDQITKIKESIEKMTPEQKNELLLMSFENTYSTTSKNFPVTTRKIQTDKLSLSYYDQGLSDGRLWVDGKIDNIVINTKYGIFHYSILTSKQQLQDYYKGVKSATNGKFKFFVLGVIDERYDK